MQSRGADGTEAQVNSLAQSPGRSTEVFEGDRMLGRARGGVNGIGRAAVVCNGHR